VSGRTLDDAAALIVGGASGMGAASARRLARELGATVTVADIDAERGAAVAAEIGGTFAPCDVRREGDVEAAVEIAAGSAGRGLRVAICCAGAGYRAKTASASRGPHPLPEFQRIVDLNLIGTFNVLRLAAFGMLANEPNDDGERGVIIATSSVAAFEGQMGQLAYAATKAGIVGMTLTAARDMADRGVRVMAIAPGLFDTPLLAGVPEASREALAAATPFPKRLGDPDEFARLAAAIVETPMLNGTTIRIDGAIRMAPR
jgi:NAD(P)-dependent dehydrogenase (short-subunit alcohol dehydrogenase family)